MSKIYEVTYQSGPGRNTNEAVDYMVLEIDDTELYVEAVIDEEDEGANYDALKDVIIELAKRNDIDPTALKFWYDDEVLNQNGTRINYQAAAEGMDDDIREALHAELAPCTDQEFFTAYEAAHLAKFGEEWELSKANPVW